MINATLAPIKQSLIGLCAVALILFVPWNAYAQMPKAVSLDYCADQYLMSLGDVSQIMAISKYATDQFSFYEKKAKELKKFNANTEELLMMKPDVVIATDGAYNVLPTLKRYNINTISPKYGYDQKTLYENLRYLGKALNRVSQAESIIDNYKIKWSELKKLPHQDIKIAYITPSGYTAGTGTFINDIIKLAGYSTFSDRHKIIGWQPLSLELLLTNPPDLIITAFFDQKDVHVSHWSLTRHPRIKNMIKEIPTLAVPNHLLSCNGLFSVEAAYYIRNNAEKLRGEPK